MFEKIERLLKNSAIYTLGTMLTRATSLISMPVLTRFLAPGEYGLLSVVSSLSVPLQVFYHLGFRASAVRHYYDLASDQQRRTYFSSLFFFSLGVAFLFSLLLFSYGEPLLGPLLKRDIPFHPYLTVAVATLFFQAFGILPNALMRVKEQASLYIILQIVRALSALALSIFLVVFTGAGALGPLLASLLVSALFSVYWLYYLWPYLGLTFRWARVRESLAFGLPTISELFGGWALRSSDRLFLLHYLSLSAAGIYSVSYSMGLVLSLIGKSIETAWTPFFYAIARDEREKEAGRIFSYTATYYTLVIVSFGLGLAVFAREVLRILAPHKYLAGLPIVPWIILASIFEALYDIPSRGLYLTKKTRWLPVVVLSAAAVNAGCNFVLIPRWGMMGAAWATLLGYSVMLFLALAINQRVYYVPYDYGRIVKIFVAAGAVYFAAIWLSPEALIPGLLVKAVVLVTYPMALYLTRFFEAEELKQIGRGIAALRARYVKK
jgi:O-antigen/teichoic acid export membrane protein